MIGNQWLVHCGFIFPFFPLFQIFAEGMRRELRFPSDIVDRIFPCLEELLDYHLHFLRRLRQRQRQEPVVRTIEDILRLQFSGVLGDQLRYVCPFASAASHAPAH